MKNAVLVSLFLAGSTLAMPSAIQTPNAPSRAIRSEKETVGNNPCDGLSSSQDKPETDANLDFCAKTMLEYLEKNHKCKEIPCTDRKKTDDGLLVMMACLVKEGTKEPWNEKCTIEAWNNTISCVDKNIRPNSDTYRVDPDKQVAIDENLGVTRQCGQQEIAGYKQCAAASQNL